MDSLPNFQISKTWDDKTQFIDSTVTITIDDYSQANGKHKITNPLRANAQFVCNGKLYMVTNAEGIPTVEDWYQLVLLPKLQMLSLLESQMTT